MKHTAAVKTILMTYQYHSDVGTEGGTFFLGSLGTVHANLGLARMLDRRGQGPSFSTPAAVPAAGPVMKAGFDHREAANSNICVWLVADMTNTEICWASRRDFRARRRDRDDGDGGGAGIQAAPKP